ncbi:MAG: HAD-IA family hydrolase [Propionivibrio sp.]|uniref:HAD family hydrolase n=1 Tax=Propionivibrio sp. TaxID=2212460 RepID=UPI001A56D005|nr:HAD-IA family hydrolase [Propionivibrio sp.]MBL8416092.1 HAD-IA family hydrolase [Propionivibrio sp.]
MGKRFDLLVFDWDGTLLDSTGAIVDAVKASCRDLGLPEPPDAHARQAIGLGLADALRHSVPHLAEERFPEIVERYRHHYLSRDHELHLFDGATEMIAELHSAGFLLAVATGKSRMGLDRSMSHCGLELYFSATRCADECYSKPHPQMLDELMAEFGVPPERTLMIGDTTHDLQMAINAGVAGLAVTYGAHPARALDALSPLARLPDIDELAGWLRTHA